MPALRHLIALLLAIAAASVNASDYSRDQRNAPNQGNTQNQDNTQNAGNVSSGASSAAPSGTAVVSETMAVTVPKVVLVPLGGEDPNLANGCWVHLYDGTNFKGKDELTIAGPMNLQSLTTPSGVNWRRRAESLTVGPKAKVTVYENEMFKNKSLTFDANQRVANLEKEVGITHPIDSIKVSCTG